MVKLTEEQWGALKAFVTSEAEYAANEAFNRNSSGEYLRRRHYEEAAKEALVEKDEG